MLSLCGRLSLVITIRIAYYFQSLPHSLAIHDLCLGFVFFGALLSSGPFSTSFSLATKPCLWPGSAPLLAAGLGGLAIRTPERFDCRSKAAPRGVFGPGSRRVSRLDIRRIDSRIFHCLRLATTNRIVDATVTILAHH